MEGCGPPGVPLLWGEVGVGGRGRLSKDKIEQMNSSCSDKGGGGKSVTGQVRIGHYRSKLHGREGKLSLFRVCKTQSEKKGEVRGCDVEPCKGASPVSSGGWGGDTK